MSLATDGLNQHPLAPFRMQAAVDWLSIVVTTTTPTQGRHVHDRLPPEWRAHAEPAFARPQPRDGETESACTRFELTIQDPPAVAAIVQALKLALLTPQQLTGIEVALDLHQRQPGDFEQLAQAAYHLHRHQAKPPTGTPRITEPRHYRAAARPHDIVTALRSGFTINGGAKNAPHRTRCYVKAHDSSTQGQYVPLPPAQHRARLEVTLSGPACPVASLADLAAFRFETLAPHFAQVTPTAPSSPLAGLLLDQMPQLGTPADAKAKAQHRRQSRACTRRDTVVNKRIHDALRRLSRSRKNAEISVFADDGNPLPAPCSAVSAPSSKYIKSNSTHSQSVSDFKKTTTRKSVSDHDQGEQAALPDSLAPLAQEAARSAPGPSCPALAAARTGPHRADLAPLI